MTNIEITVDGHKVTINTVEAKPTQVAKRSSNSSIIYAICYDYGEATIVDDLCTDYDEAVNSLHKCVMENDENFGGNTTEYVVIKHNGKISRMSYQEFILSDNGIDL